MSAAFRVDVVTLFPEFFPGPLATGLVGRAVREGRAMVDCIDPRTFTEDRHRSVDDAPYGGGAGMVMRVEPLARAIDEARRRGSGPVVLMSPQGRPLAQRDLEGWSAGHHLALVCGRYEGFDDRVRALADDQVSIGDFVLTGGEYAALAVIDGVVRLLPGTLGNERSAGGDSFSDGLLEYPQYTRPEAFQGRAVPEVLVGGHHARIRTYRRAQQLVRTRRARPDLLREVRLGADDRRLLGDQAPPFDLRVAVAGSWQGAEVPRLLRLTAAYGVTRVYLVGADEADVGAHPSPVSVEGWPPAKGKRRPPALPLSVDVLTPLSSWAELRGQLPPRATLASAERWPSPTPALGPGAVLERLEAGTPVCLCVGERANADTDAGGPGPDVALPGIRQACQRADLDRLSALGILLDRILGER